MDAVEVIRQLSSTDSRLEKESILKNAWDSGCFEFFEGCKLAYDGMITFGVKKIPMVEADEESTVVENPLTFQQFKVLTNKLAARELTGNAAKKAIHSCALESNLEHWNNWYRNILLKDLRCGITEVSINKVLKTVGKTDKRALDYIIPVFSCQLAQNGLDHPNKISGEKFLDIKLDGVRLLTVINKENRTVIQYTRDGRVKDNFTDIVDSLQKMLDVFPSSVVLDGEVVGSSFQELMTQLNRKKKLDTGGARLALFDIIPLNDFLTGKCLLTQQQRHQMLCGYMADFQDYTRDKVYVIPKRKVNLNTSQGYREFLEFNKEAIEAGYEGIMIKDPDAIYESRRSFAWLKQKPFVEVTLKVIGYEEGTGKNAGRLGTLFCEGIDEDRYIRVGVGGGFSDELRDEIWTNREKYLGYMVEVKADCLTQERNTDEWWSLRFPRFKGFRGTAPDEKI
jgi:DNA ligase 1